MSLSVLLILFCCSTAMLIAQSNNYSPILMEATMRTYSIRLKPGQDLKQELDALVQQKRIGAGVMLTCVGSLTDVVIRLANQEGPTRWRGHFEIVSFVGTLSVNGSHLHIAVADSTGQTVGGHLLEGCKIYTTAEIVIGIMPELNYTREPDPTYGYRELMIHKKRRQ